MFEFMGLIGLIFIIGMVGLAAFVVLLPFYLLFRLMGFALKVGLAGIFLGLFGVVLLPVLLLVGLVLFIKLVIIGIPLLIAVALFAWLVGFFRRDEQQRPIVVQTAPPASS